MNHDPNVPSIEDAEAILAELRNDVIEPAKPPVDYAGKNEIWDAIASAIANDAEYQRMNNEAVRRMIGQGKDAAP